jgi:predicted DCC family thiol-disulfide oxidoreductase YuxK
VWRALRRFGFAGLDVLILEIMDIQRPVLIYDGDCAFCERNSGLLLRALGGRVQRISSRAPDALALHRSLTIGKTQARIYLLLPDGRLFGGAEAVARTVALATWGRFALAYYLPGVGALLEFLYKIIAANRYKWWGKVGGCEGGSCSIYRDH